MEDDMNVEIGEFAGTIWQLLNTRGPLTLAKIKNSTKQNDFIISAALGWLAREDKIDIQKSGRSVQIKARDSLTISYGVRMGSYITVIGFFAYLVLVLVVGLFSYRVNESEGDFFLAGRRLNPCDSLPLFRQRVTTWREARLNTCPISLG